MNWPEEKVDLRKNGNQFDGWDLLILALSFIAAWILFAIAGAHFQTVISSTPKLLLYLAKTVIFIALFFTIRLGFSKLQDDFSIPKRDAAFCSIGYFLLLNGSLARFSEAPDGYPSAL